MSVDRGQRHSAEDREDPAKRRSKARHAHPENADETHDAGAVDIPPLRFDRRLLHRTATAHRNAIAMRLQRSSGNAATTRVLSALEGDYQAAPGEEEEAVRTKAAGPPHLERQDEAEQETSSAGPLSLVKEAAQSGGGQPLDDATRTTMEERFGYDFRDLRVHADLRAADSARSINALAYTLGRDVVFGAGQYDPHSTSGQHLLAHELAHAVQQTSGIVAGAEAKESLTISDPGDAFEQEADRVAAQVATMPDRAVDAPRSTGLPPYLQTILAAGQGDVALYRLALADFRRAHDDDRLARQRTALAEPGSRIVIGQISPLKQVRRMGRGPEAVETMEKVDEYLGRAETLVQGARVAFARRPAVAHRLEQAGDALSRVRGPISRTVEVLEYATNIMQVVEAVQELERIDIRENPQAAARAFDRLFSSVGALGELVPGLRNIPYFGLLRQIGSFFSDMASLFPLETRPNTRRQMEQMEREGPFTTEQGL